MPLLEDVCAKGQEHDGGRHGCLSHKEQEGTKGMGLWEDGVPDIMDRLCTVQIAK